MDFNIWANFPKYWIYCTEENFDLKIKFIIFFKKLKNHYIYKHSFFKINIIKKRT